MLAMLVSFRILANKANMASMVLGFRAPFGFRQDPERLLATLSLGVAPRSLLGVGRWIPTPHVLGAWAEADALPDHAGLVTGAFYGPDREAGGQARLLRVVGIGFAALVDQPVTE